MSAVQPENAYPFIEVTPSGIVREESAVHPLNAYLPIDVRLSGSVTEVSDEQLENANSPMFVIPLSISTDFISLRFLYHGI